MRGGTPPLGQQEMSGATWVEGAPGAIPEWLPGSMGGATQMTVPPMGQGTAKPSFWTQKNILIVAGGAVLLLVMIVAMASGDRTSQSECKQRRAVAVAAAEHA